MAPISLSDETQLRLDDLMSKHGLDADKLIRLALEVVSNPPMTGYDDLDDDTKAAIEKSEKQLLEVNI